MSQSVDSFDDYDIWNLISSAPEGFPLEAKDSYRSNLVPSTAFSCSQVFEGNPSPSFASIFQLPDEIIAIILENIDEKSLSSLALVDRGFRQLARSRQFSSVLFDYSPAKWELLKHLANEGEDHVAHRSVVPSIGICVRRFKVDTRGKWFKSVSGMSKDLFLKQRGEDGKDISEADRRGRIDAAKKLYLEALRTLGFVFVHAMPNLQLVDWEDMVGLPISLYQHLLRSPISHLKLNRIQLTNDLPTDLEEWISYTNVRTLFLNIILPYWSNDSDWLGYTFISSLLRLCASTLEILDWNVMNWRGTGWTLKQPGATMPIFTKLHCLDIRHIDYLDDMSLESFFHAPLSKLAITIATTGAVKMLSQRGCIPTLRTLLCIKPWPQATNDVFLGFIADNSQLTKLSIHIPAHTPSLDERLLHLLSEHKSLTSLAIHWNFDSQNDDLVLKQLSLLRSLEQVHIRLNNDMHCYDLWPIDHRRLRERLQTLPNLQRLAFSDDSYPKSLTDPQNVHFYYEEKVLHDEVVAAMFEDDSEFEDEDPGEARNVLWARQHEKVILKQARKYVEVMPKLKWMYFGQTGMNVYQNWKGERLVRSEGFRSQNSWEVLKEMFEWEGVTEYAD